MIAKNQGLSLHCDRLGADLEGICEYDGQTVFVPGVLPGESFEAKAVQVRAHYAFAKLVKLQRQSPDRVEPKCAAYRFCGGCSGQHMRYEATLRAKRQQVLDCLNRIGGLELADDDVPAVWGASDPWHCRNKTSLPVGGTSDAPLLGFYKRRSHDIINIDECPVGMAGLPEVIGVIRDWMKQAGVQPYNENTGEGLLRHVVVRTVRTGEMLVLLVATSEKLPDVPYLIKQLTECVEGFRGLHVSENKARNNVILGKTCKKVYGDDAIRETLLGLSFEISPLSFFQVNPAQTERLYQCTMDFAEPRETDLVVDAYAGAGTITLQLAQKCKQAIGIEIVPQAVESAVRNAERNGVKNATFYTAAVEELLPKLVKQGARPDIVVLDPPRKGVEQPVIDAVLQAAPRRIVYVSCHVPTQARDAALLAKGGYRVVGCQPVDMFCYASGIENVLCLERTMER